MNHLLREEIIEQLKGLERKISLANQDLQFQNDKVFIEEFETLLSKISQKVIPPVSQTMSLVDESNTTELCADEHEKLFFELLSTQVNEYTNLQFDSKLDCAQFSDSYLLSVCESVNKMGQEMDEVVQNLKLKDRKLKELTELLNHRNKQAEASIDEKNTLLQELHHRVKNNLQIIIGIVKMQIRSVNSSEVISNLKSLENRISSIAQVQDLLLFHKTNKVSRVEVGEYINSILSLFSRLYESKHEIVFLNELQNKRHLSVDKAVSMGLVINEIISNINKHAYGLDQIGIINIKLIENGQLISLFIDDHGKGINPMDENKKSMGFKLISALCKHLGASVEIKNSKKGTRVSLVFKNKI